MSIQITQDVDPNIPILLVDMDDSYTQDKNVFPKIQTVADCLKRRFPNTQFYTTSASLDTIQIKEVKSLNPIFLPNWYNHEKINSNLVEEIKQHKTIQLAGLFFDLCIMQISAMLDNEGINTIILENYCVKAFR